MSETEPKKRGFFSKLFGLEDEQAKPETTVTVPGTEAPPAPEPEAPLAPDVLTGEAAPLPLAPPEPEPDQPSRSLSRSRSRLPPWRPSRSGAGGAG